MVMSPTFLWADHADMFSVYGSQTSVANPTTLQNLQQYASIRLRRMGFSCRLGIGHHKLLLTLV